MNRSENSLHSYQHVSQLPHDAIGDRDTYPKRRRLDQHGSATLDMKVPGKQEAQSEQNNASLKVKSLISDLNQSYVRGISEKERILTHMQQYLKDYQHKGVSSRRISINDLARIQNSLLLHLGNAIVPQQRPGDTASVNNQERSLKLTSDLLVTLEHLYQYAHGGIHDLRCSDLERLLLENTDLFSELLAMICFVLVPIKADRSSSLKRPISTLHSCINILNLMWNASTKICTPTSHHGHIKLQMISSEYLLMCLVRRVSSPGEKEDTIAQKSICLLREMALLEEKGEPQNIGESAKQNMAVTFYTSAQLITEYRHLDSIKHPTDTPQGKMAADCSNNLAHHSNQILCQLFGWKDFTGMGSSNTGSSQSKGTRKEKMMEHLFDQLQKEIPLYHDCDIKRSHVAMKLLRCLASSQDMARLLVYHGPILKALKDIALLPHHEEGSRDSVATQAMAILLQIASLSPEISGSIQNDDSRNSGVSLLTQMLLDVASESPCIHIQHDALEGLYQIIATTTDPNMSFSECFNAAILPQILKCIEKSQSAIKESATLTDGEFCGCCCSHKSSSSLRKKSIMEWAMVRGEWVHWIMLAVLAIHPPHAMVTFRLPSSRLVPLVFQILVNELDHVLFHTTYYCHDPELSHPQELTLLLHQFIRPLLTWSEIPQLRAFIVSTRSQRGDRSLLSCLTHIMTTTTTTMIQGGEPLANNHGNDTNENGLLVSVTKIVWNCSCDTTHCLESMALDPKVREALVRVAVTPPPTTAVTNHHHAMMMAQQNAIATICQLASTVTNRRLLASHCGLLTSLIRYIRSLPPDNDTDGGDAKLKVQLKNTISQLVPYM